MGGSITGLRPHDIVMLRGRRIGAFASFGEVQEVGSGVSFEFPKEVMASVTWHRSGARLTHPVRELEKVYGVGETYAEHFGRMFLVLDLAEGILLTAERTKASAESYAFGSREGSSARETLRQAHRKLREARMYVHYAHVLADGLLPECGHPVTDAQQITGKWYCFNREHSDEQFPLRLDITHRLLRG